MKINAAEFLDIYDECLDSHDADIINELDGKDTDRFDFWERDQLCAFIKIQLKITDWLIESMA